MSRLTISDILPNLLSPRKKLCASTVQLLHSYVGTFYHEIASEPFLSTLINLSQDDTLPLHDRKNTTLLLSKMYYYLDDLTKALDYALQSEELFDFTIQSPFVTTIVDRAISKYSEYHIKATEDDNEEPLENNHALEELFDKIIEASFQKKEYQHIVGLAFEARRLDLIRRCLSEDELEREKAAESAQESAASSSSSSSSSSSESQSAAAALNAQAVSADADEEAPTLADYVLRLALRYVTSRIFRLGVLQILVEAHTLIAREGSLEKMRNSLNGVVEQKENSSSENCSFVPSSTKQLRSLLSLTSCLSVLDLSNELANIFIDLLRDGSPISIACALQIAFDLYDNSTQRLRLKVKKLIERERSTIVPPTIQEPGTPATLDMSPKSKAYFSTIAILQGIIPMDLHLKFLSSRNHSDNMDMHDLKHCNETGKVLLIEGAMIAHGLMYYSTLKDDFVRLNTEWLAKATNWSKFTITASIGLVRAGHKDKAFHLLKLFLPQTDATLGMVRAEDERENYIQSTERELQNRAATAAEQQGSSSANASTAFITTPATRAVVLGHRPPQAATVASSSSAPHVDPSPYSEAGALLSLALMYGENGADLVGYLIQTLQDVNNSPNLPVHQHGIALALGCAAMGNGDEGLVGILRDILLAADPNAAHAAAVGMGMIMLAQGSPDNDAASALATELLSTAHSTEHEKIARGCAIALGLIFATMQEGAKHYIDTLVVDSDPIVRYAGVFVAGMAYIGSPDLRIVSLLLQIAATDPSPDVQRQAVVSLGFLFLSSQGAETIFPRTVRALCDSFNPHIRAGAGLALGMVCAGSPSTDVLRLLRHLSEDRLPYVRQCAFMGLALVCMEKGPNEPQFEEVSQMFRTTAYQQRTDILAKFGAQVALGILNAGGRNCSVKLFTEERTPRLGAIAGFALFSQFWFWHPYLLFLSLALYPTALTATNADLRIVNFDFLCNVTPERFAYPPKRERAKEKEKQKTEAVALSVPKKKKTGQRAILSMSKMHRPAENEENEKQEEQNPASSSSSSSASSADTTTETKKEDEKEKPAESTESENKEENKEEKAKTSTSKEDPLHPGYYILANPTRVVPEQRSCIAFLNDPHTPAAIQASLAAQEATLAAAKNELAQAEAELDRLTTEAADEAAANSSSSSASSSSNSESTSESSNKTEEKEKEGEKKEESLTPLQKAQKTKEEKEAVVAMVEAAIKKSKENTLSLLRHDKKEGIVLLVDKRAIAALESGRAGGVFETDDSTEHVSSADGVIEQLDAEMRPPEPVEFTDD